MSAFEEYSNKYKHVKMERRDGILQLTLHNNGGPVIWNFDSHHETAHALGDVARDRENKVVIITGAADVFIADHEFGDANKIPAAAWDHIITDGKYLIMNHLDIEAPMIAAVNGPALIHAELALLCDVVIARKCGISGPAALLERVGPRRWRAGDLPVAAWLQSGTLLPAHGRKDPGA